MLLMQCENTHKKDGHYETQNRFTKSASILILDSPASRAMRKISCCLYVTQSMPVCYSNLNRLRHNYVYLKGSSYYTYCSVIYFFCAKICHLPCQYLVALLMRFQYSISYIHITYLTNSPTERYLANLQFFTIGCLR